VRSDDRVEAELPVAALVEECPLYDLEPAEPAVPLYPPPPAALRGDETSRQLLLALLGAPNLASRRPLFEQYDSIVGSRTARRPDQADAAVLALGQGAIAVSIDGNGRRVACDPRRGAAEAVYECAANLACVGAEPLGLTNCLNFGNPEKPHVAWQLSEAVDGLAGACELLGVPVVGGNVSLYNEAPSGPIFPTPVVGMVGALPDPTRAGGLGFAREGAAIAVVGSYNPSWVGSELAKLQGQAPSGALPDADPEAIATTHAAIRRAVRSGVLSSAHDIAEGGLAAALAESCIAGRIGAAVALSGDADQLDLFGEAPGRAFLVSGVERELLGADLPGLRIIGRVGGDRLEIACGSASLDVPLSELWGAREDGLAAYA
jgi:phosphoribosylformylglycinamidine synthase